MKNKLAYICSPYRGDTKRNIEYATELTKRALEMGYSPITPHMYLTHALDDRIQGEREKGIEAGLDILEACGTIIVGTSYGITEGMATEINAAKDKKIITINTKTKGIKKGIDILLKELAIRECPCDYGLKDVKRTDSDQCIYGDGGNADTCVECFGAAIKLDYEEGSYE